jgi:hypothetical protein
VESIPEAVIVSHNHRAIVLLETGRCGRRVERNNFLHSGRVRNSLVAFKYDSKHFKGHSVLSSLKHGNAIVVRDLGSPVFRGLVSVNVKPSGCFFRNWISRSDRTDDLSGEINASNIRSFLVSNFRHNLSLSPSEDKYEVTLDTSQVDEYLGFEGRSLAMPFISRITRGCCPTGLPSIHGCTDDIAERRTFMVRYCNLLSNWSLKKTKISLIFAEIGSVCLVSHQLLHFPHAES